MLVRTDNFPTFQTALLNSSGQGLPSADRKFRVAPTSLPKPLRSRPQLRGLFLADNFNTVMSLSRSKWTLPLIFPADS